jgi:hypothetical protein
MNCTPASLPFLASANCGANPVPGDDLRLSRAAQDGEHLARHSLYVCDFKVADLGLSLYFPRREECCGMRVAKRTRLCVTLLLVAGLATLMLGCRSAGKREFGGRSRSGRSDAASRSETAAHSEAGPLAGLSPFDRLACPRARLARRYRLTICRPLRRLPWA